MSNRTFADVTVGEIIDCGTNTATRAEMLAFAEEFDPLDIHVDAEAAADSPFGGLIASGIYTFALTQPPVVDRFYGESDMLAAGRLEEIRFPAPVRPDDTLHVILEVEDKRVSENDDRRGIVTTRRTATVEDELVFSMENHTIWKRRVGSGADTGKAKERI